MDNESSKSLRPKRLVKKVTVSICSERYNPNMFFEAFVELKFYIFEGYSYKEDGLKIWMLYEAYPEEGPKVKKKLATFATHDEAKAALKKTKEELIKFLNERFSICQKVHAPSVLEQSK